MTTPPSGPDQIDLRLLAELARSGEVGLPQAAWAVGIPQAEAAVRLVRMAEAGLPLRLLGQGDPVLLQQFLRSTAPAAPPGFPGGPPGAGPGGPYPPNQYPQQPDQYGQHAGQQAGQSYGPGPRSGGQPLAPTSGAQPLGHPAPPEEEFAGPIGRPITPPPAAGGDAAAGNQPDPTPPDPQSLWGIPGTASWTDRSGDTDTGSGGRHAGAEPVEVPRATAQAAREAATAESTQALLTDNRPAAAGPGHPAVGTPQQTTGLSGEQVTVTVAEVIDPGDPILVDAGYRLDDTERAVLVRTTIANAGPAPHDTMPDLYLFLVDTDGRTLPKAPVAVAGHPAHRVGIAPGDTAEGWTIFLIDAGVALSGVRWCVRPDLADRTLTWSV